MPKSMKDIEARQNAFLDAYLENPILSMKAHAERLGINVRSVYNWKDNNINGFASDIDGSYDTILLMYKDVPGMISQVSDIIQKQKVNIASLHCDRSSKGGTASMYLALDIPVGDDVVDKVKQIKDVFFVTNIRKLK